MSPGIKIMSLQAVAIVVLVTLVYIAFTSPANAAAETKDSQTGRHMSNLSKNKSEQSYSSNGYGRHGGSQSPTKITDPYSPYGNPYGNASTNNSSALQVPANNKSK
ncbi:hypothetical protein [Candidatus Nitrotoga arctica]|uniref:Uncharacterized protein n=1 Tax=Candidatus Nitrotoga arctica TaxID=453162 RepID=A0ABM8Z075_9PROT|nr:hypothetical protein [Candidatus Nitrotoga arctica]CAG9933246.1 conserved exported protein of unknown function [Candidatus Nitrotoga arctica]